MALNCGFFVVVLSKDSVVSKDIKKRKPRSTTLPRGFLFKLINYDQKRNKTSKKRIGKNVQKN